MVGASSDVVWFEATSTALARGEVTLNSASILDRASLLAIELVTGEEGRLGEEDVDALGPPLDPTTARARRS